MKLCRGTTEVFNLVIAPHACRSDYCFGCSGTSTSLGTSRSSGRLQHKWVAYYHRQSKSSLKIPIKLTDADQILHISVTDLSLTPPTSSEIIQPKDIRSMNDTTHLSCVNFNLPRIRHAPIFSDDFILWKKWSAVHRKYNLWAMIQVYIPQSTCRWPKHFSMSTCQGQVIPKASAWRLHCSFTPWCRKHYIVVSYLFVYALWKRTDDLTIDYFDENRSLASVLAGFVAWTERWHHSSSNQSSFSMVAAHSQKLCQRLDYGRIFWSCPVLPAKGDKVFGFITHIVILHWICNPSWHRLSLSLGHHALFFEKESERTENYYLRLEASTLESSLI
jgi:hypothetical protein